MFTLLKRKRVEATPTVAASAAWSAENGKGLIRPEKASVLLAPSRRQKLLEHIWQRTSLSRKQFDILYRAPLERYAELVQNFPASESHHHAYPGGMLDHGLEIVAYALKLRQSRLLPSGTTPEDQAEQSEAWTAATAYAALLHDIGKIAVDLQVELADGRTWHPWHGPLREAYRFRYNKDRDYRLHKAAAGILCPHLFGREIFDWLSGYHQVWASFVYVMAGQYEHAGTLGELVIQADRASVAQELGGNPARAAAAPKHSLQRKLLDGLRYLLKEELKLNRPQGADGWLTEDALWLVSKTASDKLRAHLLSQGIEGIPASNATVFTVLQDHGIVQATPEGKAIWKATVTSDQGWSHTFTLLKVSPSLIWESDERPPAFSGTVELVQGDMEATETAAESMTSPSPTPTTHEVAPASPGHSPQKPDSAIDDLLDLMAAPRAEETAEFSEHGFVPAIPDAVVTQPSPLPDTSDPSGEHFMVWLRDSIARKKIVINDAKALIHTTADTVYLVSPGVFQRYAQEHPGISPIARKEEVAEWQWIQKRFERLHIHRKQPSGLNIWTCEVTGPRKSRRLHGYLLSDPHQIFDEVPPNNPYLSILTAAVQT